MLNGHSFAKAGCLLVFIFCLVLGGAPSAQVIFDADFEGSTPGNAADAANLDAGTTTGSWTVNTIKDALILATPGGDIFVKPNPTAASCGSKDWGFCSWSAPSK